MSVESGLSGPVEGPAVTTAARSDVGTRVAPGRTVRPGRRRADAMADAVSTPSFRTGRGTPRRRGRRVTRILRRIELWSVLKIALVFNTIMLGVALGTVALLWGLANTTGLVDDLEGFLRDAGFEDFRFQGERMFEQVAFIGAVGALATTVFMVLSAALLNLISEITGGIRFVVIEEIIEEPRPVAPAAPLALPVAPPVAPPLARPPEPPIPSPADRGPVPRSTSDGAVPRARGPRPGRAANRSSGRPPGNANASPRRGRRSGAAPLRPTAGDDDVSAPPPADR